ncbi:thymidine phosphorylase [Anopheles sinensis]|uniref:Thymidine phosphorylase n=1 Tax=Anopheles sinensis TaxID=74873 RepID=A0A084VA00_ANOSI|nr:thymidine phosphorylase [Anopheles sinensis]
MEKIQAAVKILEDTLELEKAFQKSSPGSPGTSEDESEAPPGWRRLPSEEEMVESLRETLTIINQHPLDD